MKKMKEILNVKIIYHFYHHVVKAELKRRGFSKDVARKIGEEHHKIIQRAKDIGNSRLLSSYIMGSYFIAMNRSTGKPPKENYEISLKVYKLFKKYQNYETNIKNAEIMVKYNPDNLFKNRRKVIDKKKKK